MALSAGVPPAPPSGAGGSSSEAASNHLDRWGYEGIPSESCIRPSTAVDVASTCPTAEYVPRRDRGGGSGGGGLSAPIDVLYTVVSDACKNPACATLSSRLATVEQQITTTTKQLSALSEQLSEERKASQRTLMRQLLTTAEQNLLVACSDRLSVRILTALRIASFHDAREWLDEEGSGDDRFFDVVAKALPLAEEEALRVVPEPVRLRVTRAGNTFAHPDVTALSYSFDFEALPAAAFPAPIIRNLRHVGDASVEDATEAVRLFRHSQALVAGKSSKAAKKATE